MSVWVAGFVETLECFDAEFCPDPIPRGYPLCMVYIGGTSAAHVWTDAEIARVAHLRKLPIWVPTPGMDDPKTAGQHCAARLKALGVPTSAKARHPVHVMWDLETGTEPDPAWVDRACRQTAEAGYWNVIYGSVGTIFGQPERDGYIVANPTGHPHMYARAGVKATQYAFNVKTPGGLIDQSLVSADLALQLWPAS